MELQYFPRDGRVAVYDWLSTAVCRCAVLFCFPTLLLFCFCTKCKDICIYYIYCTSNVPYLVLPAAVKRRLYLSAAMQLVVPSCRVCSTSGSRSRHASPEGCSLVFELYMPCRYTINRAKSDNRVVDCTFRTPTPMSLFRYHFRYATLNEKDIGGRALPECLTNDLGTVKVVWRNCVKAGQG